MHRLSASLLCAAVACAALAAPAPVYRTPRASEVWVKGWEEPLDPPGDSRFTRNGGRLTLTVRGHQRETTDDTKVPRLLRDAEGDFDLRVRVGGDFREREMEGVGLRMAGVVVEGDGGFSRFAVGVSPLGILVEDSWPKIHNSGSLLCEESTTYNFRLVRRGDRLSFSFSEDGANWGETYQVEGAGTRLPKKMKVGVFAEATADGKFDAVFDQFSLTPLK